MKKVAPRQNSVLDNKAKSVVIGITGLLGTGKSTVSEILADLAFSSNIDVVRLSLSEELRSIVTQCASGNNSQMCLSDELTRRLKEDLRKGNVLKRENLIETANELRRNFGAGILARHIIDDILQKVTSATHPYNLIIIDSIRNPGEVLEFRTQWGNRFILLAVEAPDEIIERRIVSRRRNDESSAALRDQEIFRKLYQQDKGVGEPDYGLQVEACQQMADWHIQNEGSAEELREKVHQFLTQLVTPLLGPCSNPT